MNVPPRWKWASLLTCAGSLMAVSAAEPSPAPSGFRKVVLEASCNNPMELAPLPDGRVLFVERFGKVRVWKPDTGMTVWPPTWSPIRSPDGSGDTTVTDSHPRPA